MESLIPIPPGRDFLRFEERFESIALSCPNSVALSFDDQDTTYGQLHEKALQLAQKLRACGAGRQSVTGVYMTRSVEMTIALLAIMNAGSTYLPMDPGYPLDRLLYMVEDAGASLIVTTHDLAARLPSDRSKLFVVDDPGSVSADSHRDIIYPACHASIDDLAYIIYTSGTTGAPKGVMTTHRNVTSFLWAMMEATGITAREIFLAIAPISFDPHVLEILLPLFIGAKTVLVRDANAASPEHLASLVEKHGVTILQATPATWQILLNNHWKPVRPLKAFCGGEPMTPALKDALLSLPGITLSNVYGPTETTVWCSVRVMTCDSEVCIGPPLANASFHVLNENLAEAAIGETGELYIGGEGVALGYLNDAKLTSERFVPNPFSANPSDRLYRSGDVMRRLSNNCLQYLNRSDYQVKIRGFRIELLEIESAISKCPQVSQTAVIAEGTERLIAFVVPDPSATSDDITKQIRGTIAKTLPSHMIPSVFHLIDRMPLTFNRKIDRDALRNAIPRVSLDDPPASTYSPIVRKLYQIWSELLQLRSISLTDRYADLGGNSINLITLRLKVMEAFRVDIPTKDLMAADTIEAMSFLIQNAPPAPAASRLLQEYRVCRLSPSQELLLLESSPNRVRLNNLELLLLTKYDLSAVSRAIAVLTARHDIFFIHRLGQENGSWHQDFSPVPVAAIIDATSQHKTAADFIDHLTQYRSLIDVETGKLYAWIIFSADEVLYIYFIANHLIMDDLSMNIIRQELDMLLQNPEATLPVAVSYSEWLNHHHKALNEGLYDSQRQYWHTIVRSPAPIELFPAGTRTSSSINTIKKTFCRSKVGLKGIRTQHAHDVFLASCIFTVSTLLSIATVPCRVLAAGRNICDNVNDSFTVGWIAFSYPLLVPVQPTLLDTYRELGRRLAAVPHCGSGFGWLRYAAQSSGLLRGLDLSETPLYFNFRPRQHFLSTAFSDVSSLLPPVEEARLTMVGIGFSIKEFADSFSVTAAYDRANIPPQMVVEGLSQVEDNLKLLCRLLGYRSTHEDGCAVCEIS